jgi:hypothetical protein
MEGKSLVILGIAFMIFGVLVIGVTKYNDSEKAYQKGYAEGAKDLYKEVKPIISERDSIIFKLKDHAIFYHNKTFYLQDKLDSIYGNKRLNPVPNLK